MVEQSSVPVSTPLQEATEPVQNNAPGYGFMRPSFSYLNAPVNMPGGSSQQPTSSAPGMQSESPRALPSPQAMGSGMSNSQAPSFSYNVGHSSVGFSTSTNAPAPIPTMLPPAPKLASNSGSFVPGAAGQVMAPRGPLPVVVPEGNTSHAGYYPFNGNMQPRPVDQSVRNNVRADGTQETRASPAFVQSASQPAHTNSNPSATHFASNSFNNTTMWRPPGPPFQTHPSVMPRTPSVGASPGLASSAPSPSTMTFQPSLDSSMPPRTSTSNIPSFSNPTIQQQAVAPYPTLSPQAAPGPWLQPQPISGFSRPPFSPYAALSPGPYPMPIRGVSPLAASMPDIQPPGVAPAISSVGALTSSFTSGGQLSVSSAQADLPPGVDNYKHVSNVEPKDEKLDAWTAHRTETGTVYYYNAVTGQSTYEKPSGFHGESDKAIVQPSPVSWEKLAGTDWTLVTTNDGKNYYYNSTTKLSSWQIPSEVTELRKKQDSDGSKTQSLPVINSNIAHGKGSGPAILSTPAANTGGRDATALRASISSGSSSALDLIKKKLQDSGSPPSTSPGQALPVAVTVELNGSKPIEPTIKDSQNESSKDKRKDANGDGDMSDTSSDSEDEERGPSKEECIVQFKDMLKERGVAPFSKWEKELPKIVFDPRFKAIASHSARRALFEHYVRTRAEEERKEKRAAQKAALEGFKLLLEEAKEDIDHNTDYQAFRRKWGEDPRFQALDRKERENLLNERIFPLKRAAQERAQAERAASVSNFKSMLQDNGDITSNSRWSKVKDSLKSDPRYKSVKHEDREKLFNEYIAELQAAEEEVEQKAKEKRDEEEKLKERERALRKRKEREEQEVERVRMKARRKEAVESYQALLVETIKDPEASWTESKPKLEKDPQGRVANPHLDKSDLEKLFRDHVKSLHERRVVEFRALLNEVITTEAAAHETEDGKTVINSWSTAKKLLKDDQRYNKMPRKERESLWRRHAEDIYRKQKSLRDQEQDKHTDGKTRNSVDPAKSAASRRTHD